MPLISQVKTICERLAPHGWRDLLLRHGLDISAPDLKSELLRELNAIDRAAPGFEDFADEGRRGIEPGSPARSLLFHAMASPNVIEGLTDFPTLVELETLENYVYGARPPSLLEIKNRAPRKANLAIVVFASEYRTAAETVHRKHADVCFSRTGVARVGTAPSLYVPRLRGFLPFVDGDPQAIRILPARYAAYLAYQSTGNKDVFGPMRFQNGDEKLDFWVPLHKLFSGEECLRGLNLEITLKARHINEKLRRIHLEFARKQLDSGWREPDISQPPFVFEEGIAEFSTNPAYGSGLLEPTVHPALVEPAMYQGKPLAFQIPENYGQVLSSSLTIPSEGRARHAPEYVNARRKLNSDGAEVDLNDQPNVAELVAKGGYRARHYLDFTGDGWIDVSCPQLAVKVPRRIAAYSLVTAPDFFPSCDQRELMDWWEQVVPSALRKNLWAVPPQTLSDDRLPPNLELKQAGFRKEDKTATAIISLPVSGPVKQMALNAPDPTRSAWLPDASAGVFAPGWDVSVDRTLDADKVEHLAGYGLGSPFPEDAKLCAALSTFWPAVAPDATREFEPNPSWPTVSPLTDQEVGQIGDRSWDGVRGPRLVQQDGKDYVEYSDLDHTDYAINALEGKFSLSLTGEVNVDQYESRVLAMARAYQALGLNTPSKKAAWSVFSFRRITPDDPELQQEQTRAGRTLKGDLYRCQLYRYGETKVSPADFRKKLVAVLEMATLFVGAEGALVKRGAGARAAVGG